METTYTLREGDHLVHKLLGTHFIIHQVDGDCYWGIESLVLNKNKISNWVAVDIESNATAPLEDKNTFLHLEESNVVRDTVNGIAYRVSAIARDEDSNRIVFLTRLLQICNLQEWEINPEY